MLTTVTPDEITWELLPEDFVLDDEPVDNVNQPPLAAALTESLELAGRLPDRALIATNYGKQNSSLPTKLIQFWL